MIITTHAVQRWQERVENRDEATVRAEIASHAPIITQAAKIGCSTVKLGNGARLRLCGETVVTVLGKVRRV